MFLLAGAFALQNQHTPVNPFRRTLFGLLFLVVGCFAIYELIDGRRRFTAGPDLKRREASTTAGKSTSELPFLASGQAHRTTDSPDALRVSENVPAPRSKAAVVPNPVSVIASSPLQTRAAVLTSSLSPRGRSTALSALETLVYFAINEDKVAVGNMIRWTWPESANDIYTHALDPWAVRAGSAADVQALGEIREYSDVGAIEVTRRVAFGASEEIIQLTLTHADGSRTQRTYDIRKDEDVWSNFVRPSQLLDTILTFRGLPPPPSTFERDFHKIRPGEQLPPTP